MQYIRTVRTPLALLAFAALAACSKGDNANDSLATDTAALNRDINLAGTDTAAQPQLTDVPAGTSTTPATSRPSTSGSSGSGRTSSSTPSRSTPSSSRPSTSSSGSSASSGSGSSNSATIGSGYTFNAQSNARVCTNTYKVGDTFTATVSETTAGAGTGTIPNGATVTLRITELKKASNANAEPTMRFAVQSISFGGRTYTPDATVTYANVDKVRAATKKDDAKKVIGGAVIGAVAGQVLGKDTRGTITGAAAGAAAGTAAAIGTADYDGCVGNTGRIQVRVDAPISVRA